jgi:uncharacterized membrane protein SirB2
MTTDVRDSACSMMALRWTAISADGGDRADRTACIDFMPMNYLAIKHLHITCAALSGSLFLLRGLWMLQSPAMLQRRWIRIAPHLIDTVLLASALIMVVWSGQYPFVQSWLGAKVIALLLYIALGSIALKRGKTRAARLTAFIAALAVFAYIAAVALTRQAWPFG